MKKLIFFFLLLSGFLNAQNNLSDIPTDKSAGTDSLYAWEFNKIVVFMQDSVVYVFSVGDSADAAVTQALGEAKTITGNWVNTANPWGDNEVADDITASNYLLLTAAGDTAGVYITDSLAAFTGTSNIVTLGTIGTGEWQGTAITGTYIDESTLVLTDLITIDEMGNSDHGDFTYSGGNATLDAGVVGNAELVNDIALDSIAAATDTLYLNNPVKFEQGAFGFSIADLDSGNFDDLVVNTSLTLPNDVIDDTHINWGSEANQVDTDDITEGSTNLFHVPDTMTWNWGVMDTVVTGDLPGWKVPYDITVVKVSAYTDANTTTFNLEERAAATPNTAGTDMFSSDMVAVSTSLDSTSFTNAGFAADTWMVPNISATGDVAIFGVTVRYIKQ